VNWLEILVRRPRAALLLLGIFAWGLVGAGLLIQDIDRLDPCPLCIFQRLLYLVIGGLAGVAALWPRRPPLAGPLLVAGVALGGAAVAVYQSLMQLAPGLVPACSYSDPGLIERFVDQLGMLYPPLFMATGFCDSKEWVFLGLSMANWSVLCFAGLAGAAMLLAFALRRRPR
jgi:disulfide bond formation protein DsbB